VSVEWCGGTGVELPCWSLAGKLLRVSYTAVELGFNGKYTEKVI
jgi:hypothetical protein